MTLINDCTLISISLDNHSATRTNQHFAFISDIERRDSPKSIRNTTCTNVPLHRYHLELLPKEDLTTLTTSVELTIFASLDHVDSLSVLTWKLVFLFTLPNVKLASLATGHHLLINDLLLNLIVLCCNYTTYNLIIIFYLLNSVLDLDIIADEALQDLFSCDDSNIIAFW